MTAKVFDKDQLDIFGADYQGGDVAKIIRSFDINNSLAVVQFKQSSFYYVGYNLAVFRSLEEMLDLNSTQFERHSSLLEAIRSGEQRLKMQS